MTFNHRPCKPKGAPSASGFEPGDRVVSTIDCGSDLWAVAKGDVGTVRHEVWVGNQVFVAVEFDAQQERQRDHTPFPIKLASQMKPNELIKADHD